MLENFVLRIGIVSLVCSAVLLPLLILTQRLHNRYTARTCYFLWLLLALRLVLPVQITLPTPVVTLKVPSYTITIPNAQNTEVHTMPVTPQPRPQLSAVPEVPAVPVRTVSLMEILDMVWLVGAAAYGCFCLLTYAVTRWRLLSRVRPVGEKELALFQHQTREVGCHHTARLYWSEDVYGPMMLGLMRPVILLPTYPIGEEELAIILQHELTHLKRWDIAYKFLLFLTKGIHWFNPLVWWMVREASHNLELCCDDDIVRWRDKEFRHLYGEILLRTAQTAGAMPVLSTRFSNGKNQMKGRLMNMFQNKRNSVLLVCLAFIATLLLGSLIACESANATFFGDHVSEEETYEPLAVDQATEILKEQLILAYENTYGEYLPAEEKPNGVVRCVRFFPLPWV